MAEYEVLFYETAEGRCPTQDFLEELPLKVRAKITKWVDLLKREGPGLPRPYADVVRGKIRELRVSFGGAHHRLLYFFIRLRRRPRPWPGRNAPLLLRRDVAP